MPEPTHAPEGDAVSLEIVRMKIPNVERPAHVVRVLVGSMSFELPPGAAKHVGLMLISLGAVAIERDTPAESPSGLAV